MSFRCENAISKHKFYVGLISPVVETRTKVSARMHYLTVNEAQSSQILLAVSKNLLLLWLLLLLLKINTTG
jgi:hypothetical protein